MTAQSSIKKLVFSLKYINVRNYEKYKNPVKILFFQTDVVACPDALLRNCTVGFKARPRNRELKILGRNCNDLQKNENVTWDDINLNHNIQSNKKIEHNGKKWFF